MKTWAKIEGYENLYSVSDNGDILSHYHNICLKPADNGRGYKFIYLSKDKNKRRFYVHRIVATAFIPNPFNKPQVNHINCNKSDNRSINLEWVDCFEQMKHASENGKLYCSDYQKTQTALANSGIKSHLSKLTNVRVRKIRDIKRRTHKSNKEIASMFGVHRETIGNIIRGKTWKHLL